MGKLRLSLGCWNYDRTRALMDGSVQPDGIDLNYLNMPVEETFFRMLRHKEFEAAEMSLSSYTVSLFKPDRPFIAIPVFPSRFFRHSCIYVNAAAGISEPTDLIGKRVEPLSSCIRSDQTHRRTRRVGNAVSRVIGNLGLAGGGPRQPGSIEPPPVERREHLVGSPFGGQHRPGCMDQRPVPGSRLDRQEGLDARVTAN